MNDIIQLSSAAGLGTILGATFSFLGFRGRFADLKQRVDRLEKVSVSKEMFDERKEYTSERNKDLRERVDSLSGEMKDVAKDVKIIVRLLIEKARK